MAKVKGIWTVRERAPGGPWEVKRKVHNLWTTYGLNQLASAIQGQSVYAAPNYLVIDSNVAHVVNPSGISVGATSVQLDKRVDITGDTQIILGLGTANQETVTFSAVTGTSEPYTYTISATTYSHPNNDLCVRQVNVNDTMTNSVVSEVQYDAVNFPNQRMQSAAGYAPGNGWTMQFYFTAIQDAFNFATLGLSENGTVGSGNLHNHFTLGYTPVVGNDVEIDCTLTLYNDTDNDQK